MTNISKYFVILHAATPEDLTQAVRDTITNNSWKERIIGNLAYGNGLWAITIEGVIYTD